MQEQKYIPQYLIQTTITHRSTEWLKVAKNQLKERTRQHLYKRINIIEEIINNNIPSINIQFAIDDSTRQSICNKLFAKIEQYMGTRQLRNDQEKSQEDVIKKTRTWWNRTKSTTLGSILFTEICFLQVHNFVEQQFNWLSGLKQLKLFITIFNGFLSRSIKFPRTKPQPLIPHACFFVDGDFRNICYAFIKTFGDSNIKWLPYVKKFSVIKKNGKKIYQYIKGKHRCLELFTDFVQCLNQILIKYEATNETEEGLLMKWNITINNYMQLQTEYDNNNNTVTPDINCNNIHLSAMCTIMVECHSDHEPVGPPLPLPPINVTNMMKSSNTIQNCNQIGEISGYYDSDYTYERIPRPFQSTNEYTNPINRIHLRIKDNLKDKTNVKREKHIKLMRESIFGNEFA